MKHKSMKDVFRRTMGVCRDQCSAARGVAAGRVNSGVEWRILSDLHPVNSAIATQINRENKATNQKGVDG